MPLDFCITKAPRDTGINQYIELNIPSPYLSTKPISKTVINIDIRAPPPLVSEQLSLKQSRQSVPLSSCSRFLYIWIDVPVSALNPYVLLVLEVFCMNLPIRDLLWTSQLFVEYERNLYSLILCINSFMSHQAFKTQCFFFFAKCYIYT